MSLPDRAMLFTWLYFCHVESFIEHSYWLTDDDRTKLCNMWLDQHGHKASFLYLSKICTEAEKFAKFLTTTADNKMFLLATKDALGRYFKGEDMSREEQSGVNTLLENAMGTILAAGLN
jgi:hypothetical protein